MFQQIITPNNSSLYYSGRFDFSDHTKAVHSWPGSSIIISFKGEGVSALLKSYCTRSDRPTGNYYSVIVDGSVVNTIRSSVHKKEVLLIEGLTDSEHTLELFRRTESFSGPTDFLGFTLFSSTSHPEILVHPEPQRRIEFYGDSITCGYGNEGSGTAYSAQHSNNYMAYPAIACRLLNADYRAIAFSGEGVFRRHDGSTDSSLPQMHHKTYYHSDSHWNHGDWKPNCVCINLGTNDFIPGTPDTQEFINHYIDFVTKIVGHYPTTPIILIFGPDYTKYDNSGQRESVQEVVSHFQEQKLPLYFFEFTTLHDGLTGIFDHPNVKQHNSAAEELSNYISRILDWPLYTHI
ncbi:MAG: GDSL-type esterase/lipase family protein [Fibrobacterales bacterium]